MPNASELRELDDEELESRLTEYRREMLNLRFQLATGQLDNVVRLSVVRKDVARVLTILRDREIALAEGRDAGPVLSARPGCVVGAVEDIELDDETPRPAAPGARGPRPSTRLPTSSWTTRTQQVCGRRRRCRRGGRVMAEEETAAQAPRRSRKTREGLVVSDKMQATVVVAVDRAGPPRPLRQDGAAHPQALCP